MSDARPDIPPPDGSASSPAARTPASPATPPRGSTPHTPPEPEPHTPKGSRAPDPERHEITYRDELRRKALHLIALVVPLGMALLGRTGALAFLVPAALFALSMDTLRAYSSRCARVVEAIFGRLMRADEQPPIGTKVSINGATWVLVSAALLTLIFPLRIAVPAFTVFMIGDAAAAVVGRRFGRHHWGQSPRTIEGSAAFLLVGVGVMALFPGIPFGIGAAATVVACAVEGLPLPFNDNLRVPMATAATIVLLEWAALGQPVSLFG